MHILNTLGPVFLIILLGAALTKFRFIDNNAKRMINACCYWIGLPCLLIMKIGTATAAENSAKSTLLIMLYGTFLLMAIAGVAGWIMKLKPKALATFIHVSFRGNLAYIGLPVISFAFAETEYADKAGSVAALTLGVIVVVYNIVAVFIHLISTHKVSRQAIERVLVKLATNPLLVACAIGLSWNHGAHANGIEIPVVISRTMTMLGQFALPMALICVGAALVTTPVRDIASGALVSALLKTVAGPLAALAFAHLMGAGAMETGIACLMLGMPTAVASYVLTEQLDGNPPLAAGTIVTSTLICAVTLSIIIANLV
jgi:predicted permease